MAFRVTKSVPLSGMLPLLMSPQEHDLKNSDTDL